MQDYNEKNASTFNWCHVHSDKTIDKIFLKLIEEVGELSREFFRDSIIEDNILEEITDIKLVVDDLHARLFGENEKIKQEFLEKKLAKWKSYIDVDDGKKDTTKKKMFIR